MVIDYGFISSMNKTHGFKQSSSSTTLEALGILVHMVNRNRDKATIFCVLSTNILTASSVWLFSLKLLVSTYFFMFLCSLFGHNMSCNIMSHHAMSCIFMFCHVILYHGMLFYTTPCYVVSCHVILCSTLPPRNYIYTFICYYFTMATRRFERNVMPPGFLFTNYGNLVNISAKLQKLLILTIPAS